MQHRNSLLSALSAALLIATAAHAAKVDMKDPRRAVGREDDVRVDAELTQETIGSPAKVGVTYQIQNLTQSAIAIADKVSEASYDPETRTITVAFGAEVPNGATMPRLVVIAAGETKTFQGGGTVAIAAPSIRTSQTPIPRFVQIKVTVLRDLQPFAALIEQQNKRAAAPPLSDEAFDRWVNSVGSVFLNPIPVRYENRPAAGTVDAQQSSPGGGF
jgi:hypothetical protein